MSFTSGKFSHDPLPYVNGYGSRLDIEAVYLGGVRLTNTYSPRPEFDHRNPILVAFRKKIAHAPIKYAGRMTYAAHIGDALDALGEYQPESAQWKSLTGEWVTAAHIAHARRVLTKLAALA